MRFLVLTLLITLAGCGFWKSPGEQCLDSFRAELTDPESGRVISFKGGDLDDTFKNLSLKTPLGVSMVDFFKDASQGGSLVYTATNTYGARVQSTRLCAKKDGKWTTFLMPKLSF